MKVHYEEGPDSLLIVECGVKAERGESVEVPNEIGKKLIDQGWTASSKPAPKKEEK